MGLATFDDHFPPLPTKPPTQQACLLLCRLHGIGGHLACEIAAFLDFFPGGLPVPLFWLKLFVVWG